jgi:three-Cys-motif partner protein
MGKKLETVWAIDPHTLAKHNILRRYLEAWLPIMASWNGRILYIDGFAGPGKYKGGEDGSPLIALQTARDHKATLGAEIVFVFIEADKERYEHLVQIVQGIKKSLPKNFKPHCVHGRFNEEMTDVLGQLEEQKAHIAPSLVFIDPFGWSHTPFRTVKRIMQNPRCEVLITFMYEELNRFLSHPDHAETYDELFGTDEWRTVLPVHDPDQRRRRIHDIYLKQLREAAEIEYVRSFEMLNQTNHTDYFLFFGTHQIRGLEKMKEAMWRVDPSGRFQFSDFTNAKETLNLFADDPGYAILKQMILAEFQGEEASIEKVSDFVVTHTPFLRTHIKKQILKPMEESEELSVVSAKPGRTKGTFPDGTRIQF